MAVVREIRRRAPQIVPQVAVACLVAYFAYHAIQGDGGILSYLRTREALTEAKAVRAELRDQRKGLERKVELLREPLDRDLLSERARAVLNFAGEDDVVVMPSDGQNTGER